jgi:hypothetical protein
MLIDIQSMFKDIIEAPQQRRAAMQQEGEQRAQTAVGTLSGAGRWAAPLVAQMERQQPERSAAMQRAFGGMLNAIPGIDRETRTPSQQLQGALAGMDITTQEGVTKASATLRNLGYADKALELEQRFAEQARQTSIAAEEKDLREQQRIANDLAIQKAKRIETEAGTETTDRTAFRNSAIKAIELSNVLTASEKEALSAQTLAGGFDANPKNLYEITSPSPIKVGDQVLIKNTEGNWEYVTDTAGPSKVTSLLSAATLQYAASPQDMKVIEDGIYSGIITDAKQFNDYAPRPKPVQAVQPSADIEKYNITGIENSNTAAQNVNRIDTLLTSIYASDVLKEAPAGKWASVLEEGKQFLGLRDTVSQIRTALTSEKNLALLAALPKGTASDKDVALFSEGYPPDNASITEMAAWLESAKSALYRIQDFQTVSGKVLADQLQKNQAPTTIGLEARALPILRDIDSIEFIRADLEKDMLNGTISQEEAAEFFNESLSLFEQEHQFIPAQYR